MNSHQQQFQAIQSMLAAGHRCVHLERHTLLLLGGVGGFLSLATQWVITDSRFPEVGQRGLALLAWLAFWLGGVSLLDHWLTRRARARRAETLPFAQAQVTRAWWMLLSVGCLASFAMFFYGGGSMIYALWTVLLGLGVYFFGLFSRPLIEWIGLATILLGVAGLAAGLPYAANHWLNASCFAIGLPLAGWLNARLGEAGPARRLPALAAWLVLVVAPPLLVVRYAEIEAPSAAAVPAAAILGRGEEVLRLEAGTPVPLRVDMDSALIAIPPQAGLDFTLLQPMDIALRDGKPDGRYRIGEGAWHSVRDGVLRLSIDRVSPGMASGLPEVRLHGRLERTDIQGTQP